MKNTVFDYSKFVRETEIKLEDYIALMKDIDILVQETINEFDNLTFRADFKPNCKHEVMAISGKFIKYLTALNNMRKDIQARSEKIKDCQKDIVPKGSDYYYLLLTFRESIREQVISVEEYLEKSVSFLNEKEINFD